MQRFGGSVKSRLRVGTAEGEEWCDGHVSSRLWVRTGARWGSGGEDGRQGEERRRDQEERCVSSSEEGGDV